MAVKDLGLTGLLPCSLIEMFPPFRTKTSDLQSLELWEREAQIPQVVSWE